MLKRKMLIFLSVFALLTCANTKDASAVETVAQPPAQGQEQSAQVEQNKWPKAPELHAQSALIYNIDSGQIIFESNTSKKISPGGLTKYMTALLLAENKPLSDTITMDAGQIKGENALGYPLQAGEALTVADCLAALLTSSSNEIANQIAISMAGTYEQFAAMMNEKARQLGCSNANFINPTGSFDDNQKISLMDLKNICRALYANEGAKAILTAPSYTIQATNMTGQAREIRNPLPLIGGTENGYEGVVGGKQSTTENQESLLVSICHRQEGSYLVILAGMGEADMQAEAKTLLDYAYTNFLVQDISQGMEVISGGKGILPVNVGIAETTRAEKATEENVRLLYYYGNFGVGEVTVTIPSWNAFIDPSYVKEEVPVKDSQEEEKKKEEEERKKAEAKKRRQAYEAGLHKVYVGAVIAVGILFLTLIFTLFVKIIVRRK